MSRSAFIWCGVAALGLGGLLALSLSGQVVLPSYLAAWLLVLALPLGALPLVMGAVWLEVDHAPLVRALRALLPFMPLAAAMAIPILIEWRVLYPDGPPPTSFARIWETTASGVIRAVVCLVLWTILAFVYRRPSSLEPRQARLALPGIALHLVMGTMVAADWVGAVDPGLNSSGLGLLVIVAQCGFAYAAALLLATWSGERPEPAASALLAVLASAWLFLHFTQYLVVWSANLPLEVVWYLQRDGGLGMAVEIAAILAVLLAVAAGLTGWRGLGLLMVAGLLVLVHGLEWFWLVIPTSRGAFGLNWCDLSALIAVAGLLGAAALTGRRYREGLTHGV